jgi:mannose-6-phosphate isomerase
MGTHSTLPSRVIPPSADSSSQDIELASHLGKYPDLIGKQVRERFDQAESSSQATLPFLFKVLSIGKALSIQAHPDKKLAKKLHAEKPKMYKDDNHKPEMAIALTPFKGFCGFRPLEQIAEYLSSVPEFKTIVQPSDQLLKEVDDLTRQIKGGKADEEAKKKLLRQIFKQLMEADESNVQKQVQAICQRYRTSLDNSEKLEVDDKLAQLVCTLNEQFPDDIGVFCSFVLNVSELQAGESMFLMANEPHAYLEGDIMECMAASDNVVRAGLTPKARDVQVLVDMLTYTDEPSHKKLMKATAFLPDDSSDNCSRYKGDKGPSLLYDPPIEEFSVVMTTMRKGDAAETQRAINGPSILIITSGSGTLTSLPSSESKAEERFFELTKPGQVFFIGAQTKIKLQAKDAELVTFRAFVEVQ